MGRVSFDDAIDNPNLTPEHIMARLPPEVGAKIADVEGRMSRVIPTDAPVEQGGYKNADGTWTADRQQVHTQILNSIFNQQAVEDATPAPGEKPLVVFLGGRSGAGKSWLTNPAGPVDPSHSIVLNSDHIKEMLPEYQGWNAASMHEEATALLAQAESEARQMHVNVILDATLKSEGPAAQRLAEYQAAGYRAEGFFMATSRKNAAEGVIGRFLRGGADGRYVPLSVALSNTTNERTFDALKSNFDRWAIYDNNERGRGPVLVAKHGF